MSSSADVNEDAALEFVMARNIRVRTVTLAVRPVLGACCSLIGFHVERPDYLEYNPNHCS